LVQSKQKVERAATVLTALAERLAAAEVAALELAEQ
jgi:hypothetical protein